MTGDSSHGYPRARRIVKTDDFSSVFRLRPIRKTAHFVLYARPNSLPQARLGVVAAKRLAPRAVTRNAIKRATRELFRQLPLPSNDYIVRLARALNSKADAATSTRLKGQLHAELKQLFEAQHALQRLPGEGV
ncbi:MAG TPA: ribonuclease P protein component [Burkholderiaceae bacterium]|nr:ribonuclease P protein component [Burkholderiaceae bacterium]